MGQACLLNKSLGEWDNKSHIVILGGDEVKLRKKCRRDELQSSIREAPSEFLGKNKEIVDAELWAIWRP